MTGTERKVFQKYYPPDYDPRKLPKLKKGVRSRQFIQRIMAPFNMTCNTCGEYIYQGKKFNMRRETAKGELYLGLKIFRFYFRCPNCLAEITFKTDLENTDYVAEHGSTRLFEARKLWVEQKKAEEKQKDEDATDPMKQLEKRTKMSRAEMEALSRLEEIREQNKGHANLDYARMLEEYREAENFSAKQQEDADEAFVQSLFGKQPKAAEPATLASTFHQESSSSCSYTMPIKPDPDEPALTGARRAEPRPDPGPFGPIIRRIDSSGSSNSDDSEDDPTKIFKKPKVTAPAPIPVALLPPKKATEPNMRDKLKGIVVLKAKSAKVNDGEQQKKIPDAQTPSTSSTDKKAPVGLGLLANYGSSDSD